MGQCLPREQPRRVRGGAGTQPDEQIEATREGTGPGATSPVPEEPPPAVRSPLADLDHLDDADDAFGRFFSDTVEPEPSQQWLLGDTPD